MWKNILGKRGNANMLDTIGSSNKVFVYFRWTTVAGMLGIATSEVFNFQFRAYFREKEGFKF